MSRYTYTRFAQAYGDGAYNSCTYNCVEGASTGSGANTGNSGGSLVNTGVAIVGIVTLACLVLLIAVVVRIWRKPTKPAEPIAQEATVESEEPEVTPRDGDPL